jgi:DeoR family transcriptional regulator, fructose operon transcriptional repressor
MALKPPDVNGAAAAAIGGRGTVVKYRLNKLMEVLSRERYRSVTDLADELGVSEMTVRRYLDKLERENLIRRTHGGAYTGQEMIEVDYRIRETVRRAEKAAIGKEAYSLILPGESVYIDAGSTAAFLALSVDGSKRITVVTHSLVAAQALEQYDNVETILLGGRVHGATHSLVGSLAEEAVKQFKFNKAFLGTSGIDVHEGLTQSTLDEIPIKKTVASNSRQIIVLADSSKINREVLVLFLDLSKVDILITDTGIEMSDRLDLEENGIQVIIADESQQ